MAIGNVTSLIQAGNNVIDTSIGSKVSVEYGEVRFEKKK